MSTQGPRLQSAGVFLAALAIACAIVPAHAQDYPNRSITLVVPYAAGGGNDVMARIVAEKMSRTLGQQIVIENRAGAGGSNATRQVARSAPDGKMATRIGRNVSAGVARRNRAADQWRYKAQRPSRYSIFFI